MPKRQRSLRVEVQICAPKPSQGWALNEEYIYDKQCRLDNPGFLDYRVPVASDLRMIVAVIVEVPNPRHPFGVHGVGA